jgi:two-component system sensor histidine kinase YesM
MVKIMKNKKMSIMYKLIIFTTILVNIPISIIGVFSYYSTSIILKEKITTENLSSVKQTARQIDYIMQDLERISLFLIQNEIVQSFFVNNYPDRTYSADRTKLENFLINLVYSKEYLHSIYFKGYNGIEITTWPVLKPNFVNLTPVNKIIENELLKLKGGSIWFSETSSLDDSELEFISIARLIKNINNLTQNIAIVRMNITDIEISKLLMRDHNNLDSTIYLINQSNHIISSNQERKTIDTFVLERDNLDNGTYESMINGEMSIVSYSKLKNGWFLIKVQKLDKIQMLMASTQKRTLSIIFCCIIFSIIGSIYLSKKIVEPIQLLRKYMERIGQTDFTDKIRIKSGDEIELLAESYNNMAERLKKLINEVYVMQIKNKEAELKALQAQINPHFLYNSLDLICWSSRNFGDFETSELTQALATLFRSSFKKSSEIISVKEEIEHVNSYITIQKKRYEDKINFSITVENNVSYYSTIKTILQPLIENAIYHGIEKKGGYGHIDLSIYIEYDYLVFCIKDNGIGADLEKLNDFLYHKSDLGKNEGIGIQNVNERIKIQFGNQYGLKFVDNPVGGLIVKVYQPLILKEYQDDNRSYS